MAAKVGKREEKDYRNQLRIYTNNQSLAFGVISFAAFGFAVINRLGQLNDMRSINDY
jgi:hypothetical protein